MHACMHTRWPLTWKATNWLSSGSVVTIFIKEDAKKVYSSFFSFTVRRSLRSHAKFYAHLLSLGPRTNALSCLHL